MFEFLQLSSFIKLIFCRNWEGYVHILVVLTVYITYENFSADPIIQYTYSYVSWYVKLLFSNDGANSGAIFLRKILNKVIHFKN